MKTVNITIQLNNVPEDHRITPEELRASIVTGLATSKDAGLMEAINEAYEEHKELNEVPQLTVKEASEALANVTAKRMTKVISAGEALMLIQSIEEQSVDSNDLKALVKIATSITQHPTI